MRKALATSEARPAMQSGSGDEPDEPYGYALLSDELGESGEGVVLVFYGGAALVVSGTAGTDDRFAPAWERAGLLDTVSDYVFVDRKPRPAEPAAYGFAALQSCVHHELSALRRGGFRTWANAAPLLERWVETGSSGEPTSIADRSEHSFATHRRSLERWLAGARMHSSAEEETWDVALPNENFSDVQAASTRRMMSTRFGEPRSRVALEDD